jgi:glyoxylase-like metal-dependent hydrolase (beta-lactamase superfamily II)/rhodanese-related sulfurtransferase
MERTMIFRQLFDFKTWTYTYLIASQKGGEALIIDPVLDRVERYMQLFEELDIKLVKALDTHVHADHITGLGALRDRTQCVTVMSDKSKVDVVSMRVADGDMIDIEGISIKTLYTPGHTDDSVCFLWEDKLFSGDTLFIRGTGRTDFQHGDPGDQYDSIFNKLLTLPDETLVYPGHDYKGDSVSTIAEERAYNPRLQVSSRGEYIDLMKNLHLDNPKMMDVAVPANLSIGLSQDEIEEMGWSVSPVDAGELLGNNNRILVDLRDSNERASHGVIAGSIHAPYADLKANVKTGGMLHELARSSGKELVFYCAYGERSAMAVRAAHDAGIDSAKHLKGGVDAWRSAGQALEAAT